MDEVLLDGEYVNASVINPKLHKFIGLFRRPQPPNGVGYVLCGCGEILQSPEVHTHWMYGHMDFPQYITIKKENRIE